MFSEHFLCLFVCFWRNGQHLGQCFLIHEVSRSHTTTHHSRYDSSGRVISSSQRLSPTTHNIQNRQTSMPRWDFFFLLLYLILHCHYITSIGSLLDRLSSVAVRHIYFGLSKCTVFTVVVFMIGSIFNFGQWLSGSCQRDFGPACDSRVSIEFGVGSPWKSFRVSVVWCWLLKKTTFAIIHNIALFLLVGHILNCGRSIHSSGIRDGIVRSINAIRGFVYCHILRPSPPSVNLCIEPKTSASEWPQTYALDRVATATGCFQKSAILIQCIH